MILLADPNDLETSFKLTSDEREKMLWAIHRIAVLLGDEDSVLAHEGADKVGAGEVYDYCALAWRFGLLEGLEWASELGDSSHGVGFALTPRGFRAVNRWAREHGLPEVDPFCADEEGFEGFDEAL